MNKMQFNYYICIYNLLCNIYNWVYLCFYALSFQCLRKIFTCNKVQKMCYLFDKECNDCQFEY